MKISVLALALAILGLAGAATVQPCVAEPSAVVRLGPPAQVSPSAPARMGESGPASLSPDRSAPVALDLDYFKGYVSDTGAMIGSAARWRPSNWLKVPIAVFAMSRLIDEEDDVQIWAQRHRTPATDRVAGFAKCMGDGKYAVPALGALYCCGWLLDSPRAQRTALLSLESVAVSGFFAEGVKVLSHKHRPVSTDLETERWAGPRLTMSNLSFPSGHSAAAFAVATVVASEYGNHRLVPPLAYGAASLCGLSRINDNAHWASDVLVGSAIGYLTARAVVARHGDRSRMNLTIVPSIGDKQADLSVSCRF
jgi:membrane-associated phospholipid phosphatase